MINRKLGAALLVGLLIITVYPPWVETFQMAGTPRSVKAVGYAPIWSPPDVGTNPLQGVHIDMSRIMLQLIALGGLMGFALLLGAGKVDSNAKRNREELDRSISDQVITLWTIATHQERYQKAEWNRLLDLLTRRGIRWGRGAGAGD